MSIVRVLWWTALWLASTACPAAPAAAAPSALEAQSSALERAVQAVVGVQVLALADARSNATLGRLRQGSGVVIGPDGLVLTIGYLVLEAEHVQLLLDDDRTMPARVLGYDVATGFGLLQPLAPLRIAPAPLGGSRVPTVGASGATFGLLLAFGMVFPNRMIVPLIPPIPMKAKYFVAIFGALELVFGVTGGSGIAHFAHLGGMLGGYLMILYWRGKLPFGRRR